MNLNKYNKHSDEEIMQGLESAAAFERKSTAKVLEWLHEVDRRELHLKFGYDSLFALLTKRLKYSPGSAQRRVDAVRLMRAVPEVVTDIASGAVNLMQATLVEQGVRQKLKETRQQADGAQLGLVATQNLEQAKQPVCPNRQRLNLLRQIKNLGVDATQVLVAEQLDIKPKVIEKKRLQQDRSLRLEITLTQSEQELLAKAKRLLSHVDPNPTWVELIVLLARDSIRLRDPLAKKCRPVKPERDRAAAATVVVVGESSSQNRLNDGETSILVTPLRHRRRAIPAATKRSVLERDRSCQWRDPVHGRICGSRFQLQLDHKIPVRAGGANEPENLQVLCSRHNGFKYRQEVLSQRRVGITS